MGAPWSRSLLLSPPSAMGQEPSPLSLLVAPGSQNLPAKRPRGGRACLPASGLVALCLAPQAHL